MAHLNGIDNRECRLFLERINPAAPKLRLVIEGVQNSWGIALANAAFDADGGPFPIGEGERGIMACAA